MADGGYTRPKERNKSAGGRREVGREGQKKTGEGRRAEGESWKNITCWTVRERELRRREQDERFSERQREREEKRGDGARQSSFVRSFVRSGREGKGREGKERRGFERREWKETAYGEVYGREKDADVPNLPQLRLDFRGSILIGSI